MAVLSKQRGGNGMCFMIKERCLTSKAGQGGITCQQGNRGRLVGKAALLGNSSKEIDEDRRNGSKHCATSATR